MFTLRHPELLWLLAALPILWWLARPMRPRRVLSSPHLEAWQRARARLRRARPRFRGARFLLGVAAVAALAFAGAGPMQPGQSGRTRLVLVFDLSPSMATREAPDGRTRLALAQERALAVLATTPDALPVRVVAGDGEAVRVVAMDLVDRAALRAAVVALAIGHGAADFRWLAPDDWQPTDCVMVWTDGAGATAVPRFAAGAAPELRVEVVGGAGDNVGIVGLRLIDSWPLPELEAEVVVLNTGASAATRTLQLGPAGAAAVRVPLTLEPMRLRPERIPLQRGAGGAFVARLEGADAFALDDEVAFDVAPPARPRIACLTPAAARAHPLRAAAALLADELGGSLVAGGDAASADLVLVDGGVFPGAPAAGRAYLCFGTRASGVVAADAVLQQSPAVADWDRTHAITRDLDLSGLLVQRALPLLSTPDDVTLLLGERGPLAIARTGPRGIWCGFALGDSNLIALPDFARLLRRSLAWLLGADASQAPLPRGLLDLHESQIRPAAPPPAAPPPQWREPDRDLALWCAWAALLFWTVRIWLVP